MWPECKHDDDACMSADLNDEQLHHGHNITTLTYAVPNFTYTPQLQWFPSGFT